MTQFSRRVRFITNIYSTKKTMKKFSIAALAIILFPFISFAHEGHGATDGFTITHYFVEPEHAIYTWSFLLAGFILISYYKMRKKRSSK
jgi:hypothetical protein